MPLQVSLKRCNMGRRGGGGAKVKPDHCRYLAMIELHKTDNLIRLSLYELIRVLLREYMTTGVNQKVLPVLSTETLLHIWLSTEYYGFRPSSMMVPSKFGVVNV